MEVLRIKGGHKFKLKHGPSNKIHRLKDPDTLAVSTRGLAHLKPRVLVKEGETVSLGQALVEDKKDNRIKLTSPAAGIVKEIRYGARRHLEAVVVSLDSKLEKVSSDKKITDIDKLSQDDVEKFLLNNGFWPYIESFPHGGFAPLAIDENNNKSSITINAVHINLAKTEAFWPKFDLVVQDRIDELVTGIRLLSRLANNTRVYVPEGEKIDKKLLDVSQVIPITNTYPSEDVGVQIYYKQKLKKDERVISIDAETTIDIGHMALYGKKRTERLYSLAGNAAKKPSHYFGRLGMALGDVTENALSTLQDVRLIAGGLFSGERVRFQDYLSPKDTGLQAMVEDKKRIPLVFFRLGSDRYTMARTWLSGFNTKKEKEATTNNNGEERACIQCGYCIDVCPVQLMPNLIIKSSMTNDIERMEWLDINDCVDCGLCTFVCPSKIELGQYIEAGKKLIEKEG